MERFSFSVVSFYIVGLKGAPCISTFSALSVFIIFISCIALVVGILYGE